MNFTIIDVEPIYRRLLDTPTAAEREQIFCDEIAMPFAGLAQMFGQGDPVKAMAMWGMTPEQFAPEHREKMTGIIDALAAGDVWKRAAKSLDAAWAAFAPYADRIPPKDVIFALLHSDLSANPLVRGYSGFGAVPGWIMTIYDQPNDYNLPRVEACTVHEFHHNIHARIFPFNPMATTVAQYMIMEGLAESFAAELYGEEFTGLWVAEFDDTRLDETKRIMREGLDRSGFDVIRAYIFGETISRQMNLPDVGLPDFAGYAIGYRVVQAYLKHTGQTVAEASFIPAAQIIEESGYFS